MDAAAAHRVLSATFLSSDGLAQLGVTRHRLSCLVEEGRLRRLRRGRYVQPGLHAELELAGALGGRLDCVSLLSALGVFVRAGHDLHLQIERGSSRMPARPRRMTAHWRKSRQGRTALAANLVEALAQAVRCQSPRDAVATLDSAWHGGLIDESGIAEVFSLLPRRYQALRRLLDPRSESGPESLVRLLLRGLGCTVEVQVDVPGVGRVDFIVDGWLIIECDSRAHHEGWEMQKRDRRRDVAAAGLGYTTVRPLAEDILFASRTLEQLRAAVVGGRARPAA